MSRDERKRQGKEHVKENDGYRDRAGRRQGFLSASYAWHAIALLRVLSCRLNVRRRLCNDKGKIMRAG